MVHLHQAEKAQQCKDILVLSSATVKFYWFCAMWNKLCVSQFFFWKCVEAWLTLLQHMSFQIMSKSLFSLQSLEHFFLQGWENVTRVWHLQVRSLRLCGSCAMNLCGGACGRLDLFYELGFGGPWWVHKFFILSLTACQSTISASHESFEDF
jgi:hypothetical protein